MSKLSQQNKAIKLISDNNKKKKDQKTTYYFKLNTLKLQHLNKFDVAKIVFRFSRDNLAPTLIF